MTIDEMIAVLQAAKAGKQLQYYENSHWLDAEGLKPVFIGAWRVKPELREGWIHKDDFRDFPHYDCLLDWVKVREIEI